MESEDLMKHLQTSLIALKATDLSMARPTPSDIRTDERAFSATPDCHKEYATYYNIRLSSLKPHALARARKKWGSAKITYNNNLLALKEKVARFCDICRIPMSR
jgi:hypothetical protein